MLVIAIALHLDIRRYAKRKVSRSAKVGYAWSGVAGTRPVLADVLSAGVNGDPRLKPDFLHKQTVGLSDTD